MSVVEVATLASIQETTLDVVWIRDGVVCFGGRAAEHCYRAVLTTEGPPEAFAVEADRVQPALDAFASFLNGLAYPIQVLVRALPIDLASYARRLEDRAVDLPPGLAASARADALWARQTGPDLGLLDRRAFLVLPAEALPDGDLIRRLGSARIRFGHWFGTASGPGEVTARQVLDARCAEAIDMLAGAGIWAHRLDDPDLVRLFHSCWSRGQSARFDQDLGTCRRALPEGGA